MQSAFELELARMRVVQTDYYILKIHYELSTKSLVTLISGVESVTVARQTEWFTEVLANNHPELVFIINELEELQDLFQGDTRSADNAMEHRLKNLLEKLRQVGQALCVTGDRITNLAMSSGRQCWTDDNLLKIAHDLIVEFIERVFITAI